MGVFGKLPAGATGAGGAAAPSSGTASASAPAAKEVKPGAEQVGCRRCMSALLYACVLR